MPRPLTDAEFYAAPHIDDCECLFEHADARCIAYWHSMMDLSYVHVTSEGGTWAVWIPPRGPQDYDTDGESILGPFGDSYWETEEAARAWLAGIRADNKGIAPDAPPPPTVEELRSRLLALRGRLGGRKP